MKPDLSNEYFTKVIPSLDTIEIDSRYVDAKTVECERLSINGKKLETIINEEKLQPSDLVGREIIGEDDYYILWDDNGQPIDVKLPEGYCPSFSNCKGLKEWRWDLSSLEDGFNRFVNCPNLTTVISEFTNLKNGKNLFANCPKLANVTQNFPNLIDGGWMFSSCSALKKFQGILPSLEVGTAMFMWCMGLREFASDLSSLKKRRIYVFLLQT